MCASPGMGCCPGATPKAWWRAEVLTNSELLTKLPHNFSFHSVLFLLETTLAWPFRSSLQLLSSFHVQVVTSVVHFLYVIWLPFRQDQQGGDGGKEIRAHTR